MATVPCAKEGLSLDRYGHVLLSTWIAEQERTVLAAADVAPPLGDEAGAAPGHGGTSTTFNQVTSWQVGARGSNSPGGRLAMQTMTLTSCVTCAANLE